METPDSDTMPKYARPEIERRWLVEAETLLTIAPEIAAAPVTKIDDLYVSDTRLRLRRMERGETIAFKLCKKYGGSPDSLSEPIANLYLTDAEYARLSVLPGARLSKRRYKIADGSLDIFDAPTLDFAIYEREFETIPDARAFLPPSFVGREITGDSRFFCAALAQP